MQEAAQLKVDHVMGPYGPLSAANLPTSETKRWNVRRKAEVVAAVRGGLLSFEEARSRYAINPEEDPVLAALYRSARVERTAGGAYAERKATQFGSAYTRAMQGSRPI